MNPESDAPMMDDAALQRWVEEISRRDFGRPFLHRALFNRRLRTTGGRYFLSDHRIEISPRHLTALGKDMTEKIILHELCHYHLHREGKGYRHRDADFKELLLRVGGLRHTPPIPGGRSGAGTYRWVFTCGDCGRETFRKKRMDPGRYRCGVCRGPLTLQRL